MLDKILFSLKLRHIEYEGVTLLVLGVN